MTNTKTTSIYDEAAFGSEAAKALARAEEAKNEFYRMGWNNCLNLLGKIKPELNDWLLSHRQENL